MRRRSGEIKRRIQEERLRVVLAANSAMVLLYWDIGRVILDRQEREGWGAKVIDRLAADLREAFPDMKGFSPRNLKYMRAFAAAWPEREIVQEALAQITWYHNVTLIEKLDSEADRLWYAHQVVEHGWSRNILALQIDGRAHARHGKALTNFKATLPPADSDLAAQVFKDPYLFDFLGTADPRREREVEQALVDHIQRFLLELGSGFAFVGRQVHLEFASHDYYLDLLFYHLKLRCYVVIELKAVPFEPGFAGQMNVPVGGGRPLAPQGRQAGHWASAVPREGPLRRRVRPARPAQTHRRRRLGDHPRREAAEGAEGRSADGGRDRGGAGAEAGDAMKSAFALKRRSSSPRRSRVADDDLHDRPRRLRDLPHRAGAAVPDRSRTRVSPSPPDTDARPALLCVGRPRRDRRAERRPRTPRRSPRPSE
jgi:predicted nuclease of restriction endonuclease-like (RecB) superfamily